MDKPLIDDDHIISLLRKDAEASRFGSSLTAARRDKNAPKPNTRFLRNLVRNADSHNAALLAKEKAETRARLRGLESGAKKSREDAGNDRDDGGIKKRRREGEREGRWKGVLSGLGKPNTRERDGGQRRERHRDVRAEKTRPQAQNDESRSSRARYTQSQAHKDEERSSGNGRKERSNHRRRRSRSPDTRSRSPEHHHRERKSHRSRSPADHRRHHDEKRRSRSPQHRHTNEKTNRKTSNSQHKDPTSDSDSDPLSTFLGPAPPPTTRPRGRGAATSNRSTMDLRFNDPSYNPRADVSVSDSEGEGGGGNGVKDDWATSLEAMRDRAAWRIKGAARLREAGFGEQDVQKWESGGREKDERDLKWRGKGEGREWDLGKIEEDGDGKGEFKFKGKAAWTKGLSELGV